MRITIKSAIAASVAVTGMLVVPAVATGEPGAKSEKKSEATKFFEGLPEAPLECADWWDPIEHAIEDNVDLDKVPKWAQDSFEAFDEWCEAPAEAKEEAEKKKDEGKKADENKPSEKA